MNLQDALRAVREPDRSAMAAARLRLDGMMKPLGSLGALEDNWVKLAGITGREVPEVARKAVVVFCADNGVVAQGVSQSGQEVTRLVAENLTRGDTCVCAMARVAGALVVPVDIGVAGDTSAVPGILQRKVAFGTRDFSQQPAMERREARRAVETGIELAGDLKRQGVDLLATGEMGIGNTTTSAAVAAAMLGLPAETVAGRGAGLSDAMLDRKVRVIREALALHRPDPADALDVLSKVGGLDLAGMAGLCIGGAVHGVPVVLDGLISCVAALAACRMAPVVREYLLASHSPAEPAAGPVLEELALRPLLAADMRLGEGTGAVATFPLYDMMAELCRSMLTFTDGGMEPYHPLY